MSLPQLMSPVAALQQLFKLDRKVALPLVAGMAALAAAVVVKSWGVETGTMVLIASYVIGLGLLLVIVAAVIHTDWLKQALGIAICLILVAVLTAFALSAILRPAWLEPPWCLARFLTPCEIVEADIRRAHGAEITAKADIPTVIRAPDAVPSPVATATPRPVGTPVPDRVPIPPSTVPSVARVYIQFAGIITRESVTALNSALRNGGWRVQSSSGERTELAAGLNEVRYGRESDRATAEALASAVSATNITSRPVTVKQLAAVSPNLELWISN